MQITTLTGSEPLDPGSFAELAAAPRRIMDAWRAHDAEGFADVFVPEGSMLLPGVEVVGKEAIAGFMARAFAGPYRGTQVVGEPTRATVLTPDHVLLFTEGGVRSAGATELEDAQKVRATWTMVRTADGWKLAAYQNTSLVAAAAAA